MRGTPLLLEAKRTEGCSIWLRFEDGVEGEVDFSFLLDYGGVFTPLRDPEYFDKVTLQREGNTIMWPNEADLAPETLYLRTQEAAGVAA